VRHVQSADVDRGSDHEVSRLRLSSFCPYNITVGDPLVIGILLALVIGGGVVLFAVTRNP